MRKKSENKPSFTFKRIGRKVDNILSFFSIFDLRSAFDGWLDGTLLEFLKDLPEKKYYDRLKDKTPPALLLPSYKDYTNFLILLTDKDPLPGAVYEQWCSLEAMSKFRPEDRFCIGQNCTLHLPQWIDLEMIWCPPGKFIMGSPPRMNWGIVQKKLRAGATFIKLTEKEISDSGWL